MRLRNKRRARQCEKGLFGPRREENTSTTLASHPRQESSTNDSAPLSKPHFPLSSRVFQVDRYLKHTVAQSTPSMSSRGWGSQAMEMTSERDKPSSAKHRANRWGKHNKNHAEPLACNPRQAQQAQGTYRPSRGLSANQGTHEQARTLEHHQSERKASLL
ncbi:hypothetical protein Taro_049848 [Colocasia esculenta]|uniref:Uncharacterized protein n=1 Tax=Colocasia esculenta TaxID=4460 RepID=A0A843XCD0_COLES|nr:hypothetical protein [Colocasia esculenta]